MKRILLSGVLIISVYVINAQTRSFDTLNANVNVYVSKADFVKATSCKVINKSSSSKEVLCQKKPFNIVSGTSSLFCWGDQCYDETTLISPFSAAIAAGATNTSFIADFYPNNTVGTSYIRYCFFDKNNTSDSTCYTVAWIVTPVGITDPRALKSNAISVSPNPAKSMATINYTMSENAQVGEIVIYNMVGTQMKKIALTDKQSTLLLITEDFAPGIYFYSFVIDNQVVTTKKLVVAGN